MFTANEIRKRFLDFFARHGHEVVESSPLVPRNDPTLLFTNAGMVPFKNVFTGAESRSYSRAASSQKCVRAGGKHNDLENVGYTARHHTFFEMLGNFSFGDYFKDVAIELAWKLVTEEFGLDPANLLVTVYEEDDEAYDLWKKIAGLPDDRILRIGGHDNFWAMGDTGPCGPCSEIFYDHGPEVPGGPPGSDEEDGDRFVEIWNLVFMQYDQQEDGRHNLPRPSIDTGMGLERITAVLQGKHDNYDTDLLRSLIEASAEASGTDPDGTGRVSHRVIADHLRSTAFLIADGVLPSNEGRGYVLRRVMRRAMRHVHMLGVREAMMYRLVPRLVELMGEAYPELEKARPLVEETLKLEENRFQQTLDRGLRLLAEETKGMGEGDHLAGEVAFKLYDTYGFPLDLTQDALRPQGIDVDVEGFNAAMERQRAEARAAWAGSGDMADERVWFELREQVGGTDFVGYDTAETEARVVGLVADGASVGHAVAGMTVGIITDRSPFYGESGGQVGDTGVITGYHDLHVTVEDTQKRAEDLTVHHGRVDAGTINVGDTVTLAVDAERRDAVRANHSATHLLHSALRRTLGQHVAQKGSLVAPDRLRFDFAHPKGLSEAELRAVEEAVNERIRTNAEVESRVTTPDEAEKAGAVALFGEKYGDEVRVIAMGGEDDEGRPYSMELCGGTHVRRTGDIALFKILAETAVGGGVRRLEAVTADAARHHFEARDERLQEAAERLKARPEEVPERLEQLLEERRRLEDEVADLRKRLAAGGGGGGPETREVAGVTYAPQALEGVPPKDLKGLADEMKKKIGSGVVALVTANEGKASLVVGVTEDLTDRFDAVALVRAGAQAVGGKGGGGRPDMAQAGGPDGDRPGDALTAIEEAMQS